MVLCGFIHPGIMFWYDMTSDRQQHDADKFDSPVTHPIIV